jgi:histidyl-tRNA synthetase
MATAPRLLDELAPDDAEHFAEVRALLDAAELPYVIDPTLVRGLDYYTRTVFEFTSARLGRPERRGRRRALRRPDGAARRAAHAGHRLGRRRRADAPRRRDARDFTAPVDLFLAYDGAGYRQTAFEVSMDARRAGMTAQMELAGRSLKGQRKQADRLGARWLAVVGEGDATLRDMETGEELEVPPAGIVARALREGGRG